MILWLLACTWVLVDTPCSDSTQWSEVAAGGLFTCAADASGETTCWGREDEGQLDAPPGVTTWLAAGYAHACGVFDGAARCWGRDEDGQATPPPDLGPITDLAAGGAHTCAITDSGLRCWGRDDAGQVSFVPGDVPLQVSTGSLDTCVITATGAECASGQVVPGAVEVAVGRDHGCTIGADGALACWNLDGAPRGVFLEVAAAADASCALDTDGEAVCWGAAPLGTMQPPPGPFRSLDADGNGEHACGIREDGTLACWGLDTEGQLP